MTAVSTGLGRYFAAEADMVLVAATYSSGGPLVIVCHGAGQTPANYAPLSANADLKMLADSGCVVVVADLGGTNTWGIDTVVHQTTGRIASLRTWAAGAPYFADVSRTCLIGDSMGGMNAILYHRLIPANVKCTVLRCPVVAADALHDRDAGFATLINTAYGSLANWDAAVPTKDPSHANQTAVIATFASKVRAFYSSNDPTVLPADVTAFATATGISIRPMGAVGHSPTSVHGRAQADFIWSKLNA